MEQNWTKEPWDWVSSHDWGHDDETGGTYPRLTRDDLDRAFVCVNALANVADPEAAIKAVREALAEEVEFGCCYCDDWIAMSGRTRCRHCANVAALALLGEPEGGSQ